MRCVVGAHGGGAAEQDPAEEEEADTSRDADDKIGRLKIGRRGRLNGEGRLKGRRRERVKVMLTVR